MAMTVACLLLAATLPQRALPLVVPRPKEVRILSGAWRLPERVTIVIGHHPLHRMAAEAISREIRIKGGRTPRITTTLVHGPGQIVLGEPSRSPRLERLLNRSAGVPANPEGYWLSANAEGVVIAGRTPQATLFGAQTFCQLLEAGPMVKKVVVRDYPSLRWRGVHMFVGNTALPFHKKLISNVFSRFKMNRLLLQCEQAKWESLGDGPPEWAMPKKDLKNEIRYAREHGLQVIPLVSSMGHMRWLLENKRFAEIKEAPGSNNNISPIDPRTYKVLFPLYDEVIETFRSPVMHIGADEMMFGGYPRKSATKLPTASKAFLYQFRRIHRYLRKKGVKTMLWADMMLPITDFPEGANAPNAKEAAAIRNGIPKDVELIDWHYGIAKDNERLDHYEESGFKNVIGGTWKWLGAIQSYSGNLARRGHRGLLQTTWVGFNSQEKNLKSYPEAFSAMIVAAEESWNGGDVPLNALGYDPMRVFNDAYGMRLP